MSLPDAFDSLQTFKPIIDKAVIRDVADYIGGDGSRVNTPEFLS